MKYCPRCDQSFFEPDVVFCADDGERLCDDVLVGRSLDGRFLVEERIGTGAMGVVYRAYQASVRRQVAVKVLHSSVVREPASVQRFMNEVRAASAVQHPNTVAVYDFGQTIEGLLYLAMELVDGEPVADILDRKGALSPRRSVHIMKQVCDSVADAHKHGVLHRDLKPDNIMLKQPEWGRDVVKVLDFGLAEFVQSRAQAINSDRVVDGTPEYMSPETALGEEVDERADVYSLGVVLYELLSGIVPFSGDSRTIMLRQVTDAPPPLPAGLPEGLVQLVQRSLAKKPEERPQSAHDFKEQLLAALPSRRTSRAHAVVFSDPPRRTKSKTTTPGVNPVLWRPSRRRPAKRGRWAIALAAGAAIAVVPILWPRPDPALVGEHAPRMQLRVVPMEDLAPLAPAAAPAPATSDDEDHLPPRADG